MTDPFANKGFIVLDGTSTHDLSVTPIFGFTTQEDMVINAITHPPSLNGVESYAGDTDIIGKTLLAGIFYPIPAISIDLTSGWAIGWRA